MTNVSIQNNEGVSIRSFDDWRGMPCPPNAKNCTGSKGEARGNWVASGPKAASHEFRTAKTADTNLDANALALNRLLRVFTSANGVDVVTCFGLPCGQIVGPILVTQERVASADRIPATSRSSSGKSGQTGSRSSA
jgi:hypothetical protein